jgi:hypothetical protein
MCNSVGTDVTLGLYDEVAAALRLSPLKLRVSGRERGAEGEGEASEICPAPMQGTGPVFGHLAEATIAGCRITGGVVESCMAMGSVVTEAGVVCVGDEAAAGWLWSAEEANRLVRCKKMIDWYLIARCVTVCISAALDGRCR